MINFLFGESISERSVWLCERLREDAENGISSILIVPEQSAVDAEHMTLHALPPEAQLSLEVLNFSRLYNRVCREYGGLCYSYITKPLKSLMMWKTLRTLAPMLTEYADNAQSDFAFCDTMLASISELKLSSVTPDSLEAAADALKSDNPALAARLRDITLIYATYDALVAEQYSDSADDLSRLCDILDAHGFFEGKNVYIDSFTSFTAVQHKVIDRIFKTASNTCVTVPLPSPDFSDIATASIEDSLQTLKRNANKWGGHKDILLDGEDEDLPPPLLYLRKNLWNMACDTEDAPSAEGRIVMELCENSYDEAEACASHILELIRDGARYRDMAIIMRDATKYRGIIEPALERCSIPYFFSEKTDICSLAPIKFILSALRIKQYNWRRNDVISHIKTGLCDASARDGDLFEEYINTWNIQGSRFLETEWTMNPDGFSSRISERGREILAAANATREAVCRPLEELFIHLEAADTAADMCRALYAYMENIGLSERIRELAKRELSFGNAKSASELSSLYEVILSTLADIGEAMGEQSVDTRDFYSILKVMFDNTDIGTIPSSCDSVTVGSASMLRAGTQKYVFVLGLCEGEFPARVDASGVFAEADREALAEQDIVLGSNEAMRSSDELMFVRKTFCAPRERLYLFSSRADISGGKRSPSLPYTRVVSLFSDLVPHTYVAYDLDYLTPSPTSAASHLRNIATPADREAAKAAIAEHLPLVSTLSDSSAETDVCRISPELVRRIVGDRIYISPSSLEKYVRCPFSYYASYMLSLRTTQYGRFGANHIGDFVHYVLEHIIRFALPVDADTPVPTPDQIRGEVKNTVREYIELICPDGTRHTSRMEHLYARLTRLSQLIIDNLVLEFSDSDFRPAFFEMRIDGRDGNPDNLVLPLENGASVVLKGFIDRVDIWRDGEQVYVRVVDYKTGTKQFSLSDAEQGLGTQMLLYLCALCTSCGKKFRAVAGLADGENPIPAGVTYLSSAIKRESYSDFEADEQTILDSASARLTRSGIILDEDRVIEAMSHSVSKDILMGITKKDGAYSGKPLIGGEALDGLFDKIKETLSEIGMSIYSGVADCAPLNVGGHEPCQYCEMRPVCRRSEITSKEGK